MPFFNPGQNTVYACMYVSMDVFMYVCISACTHVCMNVSFKQHGTKLHTDIYHISGRLLE